MILKYAKYKKLSIKDHPELSEKWVQNKVADDPSLLGLGDIILKDKERIHQSAGRLDLLFQHAELNHRYEVEVQLGKTDETHIIRTIEYWDIERKRYPQYDHTAVIIAEDITSRFLNVISLFNGFIPLVAIQMQAIQIGDQVSLVFTTVLSELQLGLVGEDEESQEVTDRAYWEKRGSKSTVAMVDEVIEIVSQLDPGLQPKYNKFYIGLAKEGQPNNFVIFRPKKNWLTVEPKLELSDKIQSELEAAGLDLLDYDIKSGRYRIKLTKDDLNRHKNTLITELLQRAQGYRS